MISLESRRLLSAVPALSSRPGAAQKLYIDFDGDTTATWGSYHPNTTQAYDTDGNPSSFSSGEISNIQQIWARVAEKYSPFNIDVTTIDPGSYADHKAFRIVVGGNGSWAGGGTGGITYIGGYTNGSPNTGYVFSNNLAGGDPHYTAEAVAHEAGHGFGLNHQSSYSGTTRTATYNSGNSATAPIMGNSYTATRGLWWYGPSESGSTIYQDDLSILANSIGYRSDDVGSSASAASKLSLSGSYASASGVIEKTSDSDYYSFYTSGGSVSFTASPSTFGGMLDLKLSLFNSSGSTIASANSSSLGESLSANLSAGTYYIAVGSHGNYGDIGQYSLTGSISNGGNTAVSINAPYSLTASASSSSKISLSWRDDSSNETGFKIERMTNNSGTWTQIATVGSNVTGYVDSNLSAGTSYAYRVRATNSSTNSAYSNTAYATTSAAVTTPSSNNSGTSTGGSTPSGTKLTGAAIGTAGSWNNSGNTFNKALDGNLSTYFDAPTSQAYVGYDLGSGNTRVVTAVRYAPRSGNASRMVGGLFQGSNDGSTWYTLYTVTSTPAEGQFSTALIGGNTAYRYLRYQSPNGGYGNVADVEFYAASGTTTSNPSTPTTGGNGSMTTNTPSGSKISGTSIGTAGSWNNSGNTLLKAFDNNLNTYFDAPSSQAWVGIDYESKQYIASARIAPRSGYGSRMVGGQIQVSNDNSNWTTVATITSAPAEGKYTTLNFSTPGSYRYVRYLSPNGGFCNIAEFQTYSGTASAAESVEAADALPTTHPAEEAEADPTPIFCGTSINSDIFGSGSNTVL